MSLKRKRFTPPQAAQQSKNSPAPGLYIHSSPPRVLHMNPSIIRQWLRGGDVDKLEQVVLEGQGHKLVGEYSPDAKVRAYLKTVPAYMAKMEMVHEAVGRGQLSDMQTVLQEDGRKKLALCKDNSGVGLLHKAVFYDQQDIVDWLTENYPATTTLKDREGRTPLHYCAACKNPKAVWQVLEVAGADPAVVDGRGKEAAYYIEHPTELELPDTRKMSGAMRRFTSGKDGFVVTRANIRIWIHDRDLGRLQQMLWEGHGGKLRVETSNSPRVKRLLDAVPYIMGTIRNVHKGTVDNDFDLYEKGSADPVPNNILHSKDQNGLNPLHKAAGLGHEEIAKDILDRNNKALNMADNDGRLPLHYAAALKDDGSMYKLLVDAGADEQALDNRGKPASHYRTKPGELDASLLKVIPDAPRTASVFPPAWDWRLLNSMTYDFGPVPVEGDEIEYANNKKHGGGLRKCAAAGLAGLGAAGAGAAGLLHARSGRGTPMGGQKAAELMDDEDEGVGEEGGEQDDEREELERQRALEELARLQWEKEEQEREEQERIEREEQERIEREEQENMEREEQERIEREEQERIEREEQERIDRNERKRIEREELLEAQRMEEAERLAREESEKQTSGQTERWVREEDEDEEEKAEEDEDPRDVEIRELIAEGNMEKLASLVLNGEGDRLVGQKSDDPELQAFLNNVPAYMAKIQTVHDAAREGRLRDLQAALDRRRFAVARDNSTPLGTTPLHTAVLFARTDVSRYLGGRFPETLNAPDNDSRTPLHYAATLSDNGHLYQLLLNLGANPTIKDNRGRTAEYYLTHSDRLTHKKLLREYGAPETIADDTFGDKGDIKPVFWTEEGRYLAASLGDPLIKGLMEVAEVRPADPIAYLAAYLYNFANKNKSRVGTQESAVLITAAPEQPVNDYITAPNPTELEAEEEDEDRPLSSDDAYSSANRDEHGQSMLHFAAARSHGRNALFQLLQETHINVGYRDELYRTARDVAIQANLPDNIHEIDMWVLYLAANGETQKLSELLLEGYDHITDIEDEEDNPIHLVVEQRKHNDTLEFLNSISEFEESRDRLHRAIRTGDLEQVQQLLSSQNSQMLAKGKNVYGRCTLHVAILCQNERISAFISEHFPQTLRVGDNLERTALHYAMGVENVEALSTILIKAGAKRVLKDLKGRQPSYYFMNKSDILRLQDDEESLKV